MDNSEYWQRQRELIEQQEALKASQEAIEKRLEAERDPALAAKKVILSKKEQEALKQAKNKQGVRMRKTPANKKKFDPEAAAARK